jgi:hypothetical protein
MTRSLRKAGRVLAVSALTLGTVPLGSIAGAAVVHTDTTLAGFSITVEATPLRVLVDDPELAIPHDPGTAVLEGDPNYTLASVSTGPNAHALTSTLWPGNLLGTGLNQIPPAQSPVRPAYPIKGEARYPDKPYDTTGVDGGAVSGAHAEGLDATATADGSPENKPGQVRVGTATATSTASVTAKNIAVGTANSAVGDIELLAGVIKVGAVKTTLSATADGKRAVANGTTTVSGLTIANQAFTVDDQGLHAAGQGSGLPVLATPDAVSTTLGISAHALNQVTTKTADGVSRVAGGLIIDVNTGPLRALLAPGLGPVTGLANSVLNSLPDEADPITSNLYYFVKATPHITFIIASANASSAATRPITLPPISFPSFPSTPGTFVNNPPSTGLSGGAPLPDPGVIGSVVNPPQTGVGATVIPPTVPFGPGTTRASGTPAAGFGGIGVGWLLGAGLGAGLIGWTLLRFLGLAGGALLGIGCRLGAPTSVPNLRSVTS